MEMQEIQGKAEGKKSEFDIDEMQSKKPLFFLQSKKEDQVEGRKKTGQ